MASQAIGSLFVSLGLDTATFTAGVKKVQGVTGKLQKGFERFGTAATNLGAKMSVISAGMAAAGLAAAAMVKQTADAAVQIDRQAKIANASSAEFQRWAAGAKRAGIDQDKLADILKDVNDRVGDFLQTGGGPMADFFEKVAPKVGVTAEQFKNLSGPDALQLYVDTMQKAGLSQQEMTFYMEAMAGDATALLPLLLNGGKAMDAYGDAAARSGAVMSEKLIAASVQFNDKLNVLSERLTGARNQLAEVLLPVINRFLDVLITQGVPALESVVTHLQGVIDWFGQLPVPVQEAAGVIALALGVGGPILLAVGALSLGVSALLAATGPIGLFIAAAALLTAAWAVWGDDIKAIFGSAVDWIGEKYGALKQFFTDHGDQIAMAMTGPLAPTLLAWDQWGDDIKAGLATAVEWIKQKFNELMEWFRALPAKMMEIGQQIIDGLVNGITERWDALKTKVTGIADGMAQSVRDALGIHSPSRVFAEIGNFIMQGLGLGVAEGAPGVQAAMTGVTDAVTGEGASMSSSMDSFASSAKSAFSSVIEGSKSVSEALKELAANWLSSMSGSLFDAGWSGLMGAFGINVDTNANGTRDFRGGLTRVNERGGEIMNLPAGTQIIPNDISKRMADASAERARQTQVMVVPSPYFDVRVDERASAVSLAHVSQANRQMPDRSRQIAKDPRRR